MNQLRAMTPFSRQHFSGTASVHQMQVLAFPLLLTLWTNKAISKFALPSIAPAFCTQGGGERTGLTNSSLDIVPENWGSSPTEPPLRNLLLLTVVGEGCGSTPN